VWGESAEGGKILFFNFPGVPKYRGEKKRVDVYEDGSPTDKRSVISPAPFHALPPYPPRGDPIYHPVIMISNCFMDM